MSFRPTKILFTGIALIVVTVISGCAAKTSVVGNWEPGVAKNQQFKKVLVVSLASKSARRQEFEDALVANISGVRIEAISAQSLMNEDTVMERDVVVELVKQTGADSVLVTRVTDQVVKPKEITEKQDAASVRGNSSTYGDPYGDFGDGSSFNFVQYDYKANIDTKDYVVAEVTLRLQSEFYDVRTAQPIYRVDSFAEGQTEPSKMINELAKKIGRNLRNTVLAPQ